MRAHLHAHLHVDLPCPPGVLLLAAVAWLPMGSRWPSRLSPSFTGAMMSSKMSLGIDSSMVSSLRRVKPVAGRTSLRIFAQKGSTNQFEGNDSRGTGAGKGGAMGGAGGGDGGAELAGFLGLALGGSILQTGGSRTARV